VYRNRIVSGIHLHSRTFQSTFQHPFRWAPRLLARSRRWFALPCHNSNGNPYVLRIRHISPRGKASGTYAHHMASYPHKSPHNSIPSRNLYRRIASTLFSYRRNRSARDQYACKEDKGQHDMEAHKGEGIALEESAFCHRFVRRNGAVCQIWDVGLLPLHTNKYN
jgi:hypothetical protein